MKFFKCEHCGNIVTFLKATGVPVMCCGQKMTELVPGTVDASVEKHVPAVSVDGSLVSVQVGSVEHPMVPEHSIEWVAIETNLGSQIKYLKPEQAPKKTGRKGGINKKTIQKALREFALEKCDDDGWIAAGQLASLLDRKYPDFDVRNFGYKKLYLFVESLDMFELKRDEQDRSKLYFKLKQR